MAEGIKYDEGKPQVGDMIKDFGEELKEVSRVWEFGAGKYGRSNWKLVEDGERRYTNALVRHLIREEDRDADDESGLLHATHVAWNALARLHFILEKRNTKS